MDVKKYHFQEEVVGIQGDSGTPNPNYHLMMPHRHRSSDTVCQILTVSQLPFHGNYYLFDVSSCINFSRRDDS